MSKKLLGHLGKLEDLISHTDHGCAGAIVEPHCVDLEDNVSKASGYGDCPSTF